MQTVDRDAEFLRAMRIVPTTFDVAEKSAPAVRRSNFDRFFWISMGVVVVVDLVMFFGGRAN